MDVKTVAGACRGCGAELIYTLHEHHGAPELHPPVGSFAYGSGHLCSSCDDEVDKLLSRLAKRRVRAAKKGGV